MTLTLTERKIAAFILAGIAAAVVVTVGQDFLRAKLQDSGFYLSESLLFTSFWWLFFPFLSIQYFLSRSFPRRVAFYVLCVSALIGLHLISFPVVVWAISALFYENTFAVAQTLRYASSEHLYQLIAVYPTALLVFRFFAAERNVVPADAIASKKQYAESMLVSKAQTKHSVKVSDISYFLANPPYVMIHVGNQSYFHTESLRSILEKLDPEGFCRVHKSAIVNLEMVQSVTTKRSGDGEITLQNGTKLRLSRTFAPEFKSALNSRHDLAQNRLALPHCPRL